MGASIRQLCKINFRRRQPIYSDLRNVIRYFFTRGNILDWPFFFFLFSFLLFFDFFYNFAYLDLRVYRTARRGNRSRRRECGSFRAA